MPPGGSGEKVKSRLSDADVRLDADEDDLECFVVGGVGFELGHEAWHHHGKFGLVDGGVSGGYESVEFGAGRAQAGRVLCCGVNGDGEDLRWGGGVSWVERYMVVRVKG